ncbi:NrfD/PsrC family molybdoenzyme membrane anchor subunit [Geobacter sp. DSM 9736]|uniref:NrfD/PsrC family molybdoenzyme membrane anchor subunit n=1 Tax=Geobacter sp. DSM 9736 TaxID=1277350 RepID=UPI000B5090FB|nr:NrfD/PsrC family molybdoenzyme membrane anchor subunit [Geobacter sp. DSM 9736]SNB44816.1 prokaryotic molybdopterin-containing oxidoreductase family, membrane subunit [Geobacter sp. DSM 9736]
MQFSGVVFPDRERLSKAFSDVLKGKGGIPFYLSLIGLVVGFYAIATIFIQGHAKTINTSNLVPWGLQISTYIYFALLSTGCTFVNFFGHVFFEEKYRPFASRIIFIGIITAVAAFFSLATEMGRIDRMYNFLLSPNPKSPMFWMAVWYTCYVLIITKEYINIQTHRHSNRVMWGAFFTAVITHSTLGSLLGTVSSRVYYYSAIMPIYFLFIAFLTGCALTTVIAARTVKRKNLNADYHLSPFVVLLKIGLGLALILTFWRTTVGLTGHMAGSEVFSLTLINSFVFGIVIVIIIPYLLLKVGKGPNWLMFVGIFIMVTQLKARNDLVIGAFKIPVFRVYEMPEVVHYSPSIYEYLVVVASASLVTAVYSIFNRSGVFDPHPAKEVN